MEKLQKKAIQIMTDKGSWQFTDEQIIKIKNKDIEAMTKFYYDNFKLLSAMARKYARNEYYRTKNYIYDDLIQQVFLDLPYYNYSTRTNLWYGIVKGTFKRINYGGYACKDSSFPTAGIVLSYEGLAKDSSNSNYYLDKVASYTDNYDEAEEKEERKQKDKAIELFLERTIKNPKDLNAMWCRLFTDLPLNQIKGDEYERYKQCRA